MNAAADIAWARCARDADEMLDAVGGPLRVIRRQCHAIVRAANRPQELIERLQTIDGELDRLARSAEQMRRVLAGEPRDVSPAVVDLVTLVRTAVTRFAAAAVERGVVLRVDAHDRCGEVVAHPDAIHRVIDQLLDDALARAPVGSAVTLALTECGSRAVVRVIDERSGGAPRLSWAIASGPTVRKERSRASVPRRGGASVRIARPTHPFPCAPGAA